MGLLNLLLVISAATAGLLAVLAACWKKRENRRLRVDLALQRVRNEILQMEEEEDWQLQQVVLNLVQNGRDAIAGNGGQGRVAVRTKTQEGRVLLIVEDDGPGIPPEIRERVFEPFFTTRDVGQGTGLGLSVCRGIVRAHGGRLRLVENGRGGCLELELPTADGRGERTEPAVRNPQEESRTHGG